MGAGWVAGCVRHAWTVVGFTVFVAQQCLVPAGSHCVGLHCCVANPSACPESNASWSLNAPPGMVIVRDANVDPVGSIQMVVAIVGLDGAGSLKSPFLMRQAHSRPSVDGFTASFVPVEFTAMPRGNEDYLEWVQSPSFDGHGVIVHRVTLARDLSRLLNAERRSHRQSWSSPLQLRIVFLDDSVLNSACFILGAGDTVDTSAVQSIVTQLLLELRNFDLVLRDPTVHYETLRLNSPALTQENVWSRVLRGVVVYDQARNLTYAPLQPITEDILAAALAAHGGAGASAWPVASESASLSNCRHRYAIQIAISQSDVRFRRLAAQDSSEFFASTGVLDEEMMMVTIVDEVMPRCVFSFNPRTASMFVRNFLHAYGGQEVFEYRQASAQSPNPCDKAALPPLHLVPMHLLDMVDPYQLRLNPQDPRNWNSDGNFSIVAPAILTGDEFCNAHNTGPWNRGLIGRQYDAQKYDFEQYDSPTNLNENLDTESAEGGNSTTAGSKGKFRRHRLYVPLAVRYELAAFHGVVPPRRRRFLANFVGSTGTHESRLDMKAAIQRWDATLPPARADAVCMWHFADDWVPDPGASSEHLNPPEYQRVLLDSYFTLCPAGHAFETFRFWEAVDVLSIPIIVHDQAHASAHENSSSHTNNRAVASESSGAVDWDLVRDYSVGRCGWRNLSRSCNGAFRQVLQTNPPIVILDSWDDLPDFLTKMLANPHFERTIRAQQQELRRWLERWWRGVATKVDNALRPFT